MHTLPETPAVPYQAPPDVKRKQYSELQESLVQLLKGETCMVSGMATCSSLLHHAFEYFSWTGFYMVVSEGMLSVGPYQGTLGCLRIPFSRGVCGAAATQRATMLVPNVEDFPGHIACDSRTKSEIVVPVVTSSGELLAVLDVDSLQLNAFDEADQHGLESICKTMGEHCWKLPRSWEPAAS